MDEELNEMNEINGTVTFANEVLTTIAGIAACSVPGVAGMSGGFKDGIVELLGMKNLSKGVRVTSGEKSVTVDIQIVIEYGVSAPEVCEDIQLAVEDAIVTMTGLDVFCVNIAVQGVKFKEIGVSTEE